MKNRAPARRCLLLAAFLSILASPAQAQVLANAYSFALYDDQPGFAPLQTLSGAQGALSSIAYTSPLGLASAGYGEAAFGALHVSASAIAANAEAQTRGQGGAYWYDRVTFSSAVHTGAAFARVSFSLSGGLSSLSGPTSVGAAANSSISAVVRVDNSTVFNTSGQLVSRNGAIEINDMRRGAAVNGVMQTDPVSSLAGVFSFDIPFTFGTSFLLNADMVAFTTALTSAAGDQASAHSNFGSSGYWGGLTNVHLADGTLLSDYSVSSASGFDWTSAYPALSPIPEPQTYALLLAGLLLIGVRARKGIRALTPI